MIKVRCTCGKVLSVKPEHSGKKVRCPACQTALMIPAAEPEIEIEVDVDEPPEPPRKSVRTSGPAPAASTPAPRSVKPQKPSKPAKSSAKSEPSSNPAGSKPKKKPAPQDDVYSDEYSDEFGGYEDDYESSYDSYDSPPAKLPPRRKGTLKSQPASRKDDDGTPVPAESPGLSKGAMYGMFGFAGTVAAVVMFFVVRSFMNAANAPQDGPSAIPKAWITVRHEQNGPTVQAPDDWPYSTGGGTGGVAPWIRMDNEPAGVTISIRGSIGGTAIGDIASGGGQVGNETDLPDELDPIVAVHNFTKDKIASEYNSYTESAPEKITTGMGEGRICTFEGGKTLGGEYGVRATLMSNQYQYNVICKCPKNKLGTYRPIFEQIIKSVGN